MDHYLAFLLGLVALVFSADQFVKGASIVAKIYRVSPLIVGVVVLGFGTSLPESLVSITAAYAGDLEIGTGNIIGSNVANLTLVMGSAAFLKEITMPNFDDVLRKEGILTFVATAALAWVFWTDASISRLEGTILLGAGILTMLFILKNISSPDLIKFEEVENKASRETARIIFGLSGTVAGAYFTVKGADGLATSWGISGGFVGYLLIAIGTSLPELVTTAACAKRGETEMIIGNLFGSNIFNCLLVGGLMGVVGPGAINEPNLTGRALVLMLAVTAVMLVLAALGKSLNKRDGYALLLLYIATATFIGMNSVA
ncbi:MAG: calcium/sodium antiporter [Acidimicrobiales bacterium]|tara:strand:+ start:248 stop:1192 length:945 start_codon:yes stop_codon:yes gene_type:complete